MKRKLKGLKGRSSQWMWTLTLTFLIAKSNENMFISAVVDCYRK